MTNKICEHVASKSQKICRSQNMQITKDVLSKAINSWFLATWS